VLTSRAIMKCLATALAGTLIMGVESVGADTLSLFEAADLAAKEQRLDDMERAYDEILASDPDNVRALSGKAAAQAWTKRYSDAQRTYKRAIELAPHDAENHVGLGYAYAWNGDYPDATSAFNEALRLDPKNLSARKGIAYSQLWSGQPDLALESFERARSFANDDPEIAESSGVASQSMGRTRDALRYFDEALRLDPDRSSALNARRDAYTSAPAFESTARVGNTTGAGAGLRYLEFAHSPSARTRLAVRYDNTIGLDNPSVADRNEEVPGYFAVLRQSVGSRWQLTAELGRRDLPAGEQDVLGLQAHYRLGEKVVHFGGELGKHDAGHSDKLLHAGINLPLGERFRIDPTIYLSSSGPNEDNEWRAVVNLEYRMNPYWTTGLYAGGGSVDAVDQRFDGGTVVAGAWANLIVADRHTLQFLVRREDAPATQFTVVEIGFTFRLPGN